MPDTPDIRVRGGEKRTSSSRVSDDPMGKSVFLPNSLKTRLILGSLVIFLASLWSLSFHASWTLRADMERLLKALRIMDEATDP